MHRIFLPLYKFFQGHKSLLYILLIASTVIFAWFASRLRYEEDIIKLLPRSATSSELAFSDIDLVDKVFVQVTSRDSLNPVDPLVLGDAVEEFCDMLERKDSATHFIGGVLSTLDIDTAFGAMDYAMNHLPSFVDTSWYAILEQALSRESIERQMQQNAALVMEDETGDDTQMVAIDPLGLRDLLLGQFLGGDSSAIGGFNMDDGHFFCMDKTVALAFIAPNFNSLNSGESTRFVNMVNKARKEYETAHPELRILVHGNPQGSVSNAGTIKRDLVWTVGLSLLLILLIMFLSFHNFTFIWQQIVPVIYGAVFSLACMYWVKGVMSLMALGISAIVLGVAISYCLHVLIHFYYVGDVEKMLRDESTPVILGCITTVGAFMGLLFTESDLLRDFGLFSTFALIGNTLFALIFLPHFMSPKQIQFKRSHGFPLVERLNSLPWDRNKWVISSLLVIILVGVLFSPRVKFDSDLRNLDYDDPYLTECTQLYNSKNSDGYVHMYFAAWDDNLDQALEYNKVLYPALDSLQKQGLVKAYSPVARLLFQSQADQKERIDTWNRFWPRNRVAQLRRDLSETARENDLPTDLFQPFLSLITAQYEPGNLYEADVIPAGLMSNYLECQESGRYMVFTDVAYAQEDQDQVWDPLAALPHIIVLEPFYYCRDMVEIVHDDFSTTLWISSIFVFIVLLLSFRNILIALVAFFPMFISWYVMQGYMAIFGLEFNLINIVISTFIYGIGVDYSIFVMEGLLADARRGESKMLVYHKVAIFYSALILFIVTFSLIFATHPAIHSIGIITMIGMASTILITYSIQPWVFRLLCIVPFFRRSFGIPDQKQ